MGDWIKVDDAVPNEGDHVLIGGTCYGKWFYAESEFERGTFWLFDQVADSYCHPCLCPSHWMPLPAPPNDA